MPNCTCFEPGTSKQKCPACGYQHDVVEAVPRKNKPRKDPETVRFYPVEYDAPEYSRKFVRFYEKPPKKAEGKPQ